jgi:hypothetical protein
MKTTYERDTCVSMFIAALFTIARMWNQPWCPSPRKNVVYIHKGVLFGHKEEWNYVVCRKIDGIGGYHVK